MNEWHQLLWSGSYGQLHIPLTSEYSTTPIDWFLIDRQLEKQRFKRKVYRAGRWHHRRE